VGDFPGQEVALTDWSPAQYSAFRGLRLRPALDLLAQIPDLPLGDVVDLGCGDGAVAAGLATRFGGQRLLGVDASLAMLEKARETGLYRQLAQADIGLWEADAPPALIFSNAALHWLPSHETLMPRLAGMLAPNGVLAVQMPCQFLAPSHRLIRELAAEFFAERFDFSNYKPPVLGAAAYHTMLAPVGEISVWETEYLQVLDAVAEGHPVRAFTESTALRPVLQELSPQERRTYLAAYDAALSEAYPALPDGRVLFPFRRLFFVLRRHD
jgi:trans-aconitate 2-methyltransferase